MLLCEPKAWAALIQPPLTLQMCWVAIPMEFLLGIQWTSPQTSAKKFQNQSTWQEFSIKRSCRDNFRSWQWCWQSCYKGAPEPLALATAGEADRDLFQSWTSDEHHLYLSARYTSCFIHNDTLLIQLDILNFSFHHAKHSFWSVVEIWTCYTLQECNWCYLEQEKFKDFF